MMRTFHKIRTTALPAFLVSAVVTGLVSGCGLTSGAAPAMPSTFSSTTLPSCPAALSDKTTFVALTTDSGPERSIRLQEERLAAIAAFAEQAAACHSALEVVFDPGQTETRILWSGNPDLPSGTTIAYDRRSSHYITTEIIPTIRHSLSQALRARPPAQATPLGAFEVLAEMAGSGRVDALVLSSFIENDGTMNLDRPLSAADARRLATSEPLPHLRHAEVAIEGVGQTSDLTPAPSGWLFALRTFALTSCKATGATCSVDTQVLS